MTHTHTFERIGDVTMADAMATVFRSVPGVEVVCVECGQVRRAYASGLVSIIVQGGGQIDDHAGGS